MRMNSASLLLALVSLSATTTNAFLPASSVGVSFGIGRHQPSLFVLSSVDETTEASGIVEEDETGGAKRKINRERHTIFVGNLPFDMSETGIKEIFEPFGKVDFVSIPRRQKTNQSRGFAFVDLSTAEQVQAAVAALDGKSIEGRIIRVSESVPKDEVVKQPREEKPDLMAGLKKIYLGNIPFDCTNEDITKFYAGYELTEVYIPFNNETGTGRGFAFVTMKEEDADRAIQETNGLDFGGRKLVVSVPLPPGKKMPERYGDRIKLYVGNLSFYTVKDTLKEIFEEFGKVHDCYLPEDPATGGTRGFGFVTMDKESAERAIAEIDGIEVDGRLIRVNAAQPKKND